jgi:hypothetical protein
MYVTLARLARIGYVALVLLGFVLLALLLVSMVSGDLARPPANYAATPISRPARP